MGHHTIRNEKNCLNCGTHVEERFCPHCGQENIETRHSFHYLIGHFVEDLTHYDGSFWKTIKYLLFNPGKLTKEYLAGKRISYVPPVKLYIFISFITFFLMAILPWHMGIKVHVEEENTFDSTTIEKKQLSAIHALDSLSHVPTFSEQERKNFKDSVDKIRKDKKHPSDFRIINISQAYNDINSVREIDSLQNSLPENKKPERWKYYFQRKYFELKAEGYSDKQIEKRFQEMLVHNIPKAIFFYMPFFAFWLWLFHSKKKWYYFDHGIFSLHYFSFLLSMIAILAFLLWIAMGIFPNVRFLSELWEWILLASMLYMFFYFFRSHSRIYQEGKVILTIKVFALFLINLVFLVIFSLGFVVLTAAILN